MTRFECIESTIDVSTTFYEIRVWVGEDQILKSAIEYKEYLDELVAFIEGLYETMSMTDLILEISKKPYINAIQIKDKTSSYSRGLMVYLDTFESRECLDRIEDLERKVSSLEDTVRWM